MSLIYQDSASVIKIMDKHHRGLRDAFYNRPKLKSEETNSSFLKQVFALVCNVSRDHQKIKDILVASQLIPATYQWNGSNNRVSSCNAEQNSTCSIVKIQDNVQIPKKGWSKRSLKSTVNQQLSFDPYLLLVMTWDLLYGQGIKSGGSIARLLKQYEPLLMEFKKKDENSTLQKRSYSSIIENNSIEKHKNDALYRYLRVNTTRIPVDEALKSLNSSLKLEGIKKHDVPILSKDSIVADVIQLNHAEYSSQLVIHPLLLNGSLVFQDRASCLSALSANIQPGMTIVDTCSAPGSKTIHCIDLLKGNGHLIAIEKDLRRAKTLIQRLKLSFNLRGPYQCPQCLTLADIPANDTDDFRLSKKSKLDINKSSIGSKSKCYRLFLLPDLAVNSNNQKLLIEVWISDFIKLDESILFFQHHCANECRSKIEERKIDVMIVDPSCSSSGLPIMSFAKDKKRVELLASFQERLLRHALTAFPSAQCICYSTCSIYLEENERVLDRILRHHQVKNQFHLVEAVPFWKTVFESKCKNDYLNEMTEKNHDSQQLSKIFDLCFHSHPHYDRCRGFFLAKLIRNKHN